MKQCRIAVFAENADTILSVFNPAVYERLFPGSRLSVQFRHWENHIRSIHDEVRTRVGCMPIPSEIYDL